jgi:hypothetical protein
MARIKAFFRNFGMLILFIIAALDILNFSINMLIHRSLPLFGFVGTVHGIISLILLVFVFIAKRRSTDKPEAFKSLWVLAGMISLVCATLLVGVVTLLFGVTRDVVEYLKFILLLAITGFFPSASFAAYLHLHWRAR